LYQWIVFTSANAVNAFATEMARAGVKCKAQIAAVGSATREAAEAKGLRVQLVPEHYIAESLTEAFASEDLVNRRILIPSAAVTRDAVAPALRQRGARVDVVEAYRNILPRKAAEQAGAVFRSPYPDWVTFASSSAVTNLVNIIGTDVLKETGLATIGPATSETARNYGLNVAAEAQVHTVAGLVKAIMEQSRSA
jgi:uroporphyrinogen III methyltransferase/synthase